LELEPGCSAHSGGALTSTGGKANRAPNGTLASPGALAAGVPGSAVRIKDVEIWKPEYPACLR